jgi:hypothetical protein
MTDHSVVNSFVLRFSLMKKDAAARSAQRWRIKVTHVQNQEEVTVHSMEEAYNYMNEVLERGVDHDSEE